MFESTGRKIEIAGVRQRTWVFVDGNNNGFGSLIATCFLPVGVDKEFGSAMAGDGGGMEGGRDGGRGFTHINLTKQKKRPLGAMIPPFLWDFCI